MRRVGLAVKQGVGAFTASAEDPRQTFAPAYQRQGELLQKVQQALVDIGTAKDRLESKTAEVGGKLPQLEEQARRALIAEREDLARLALQRRQIAVVELEVLEGQVREVQQEEQRLSMVEQRLATQIEAFYARQEVIAARYTAAEAQVRIGESLSGISDELDDLGRALERAEEKTEHMQARASAIDRLVETGVLETPGLPAGDPVAHELGQLEGEQDVEAQLAALSREIEPGRLPPPAQS